MDEQQKAVNGESDVCEICREVTIYLEAFETSVVQAVSRLAEEQVWTSGAAQIAEPGWQEMGEENTRRLTYVLRDCIERMHRLQEKIETHIS